MDLTTIMSEAVVGSLTTAIRAASVTVLGVSHNGREVIVHLPDGTSQADQDTTQAIVDAHDPAVITAVRDGETVTVSVSKPRNLDSATEVTLTVDGTPMPVALALETPVDIINGAMTFGVETYPYREVTI